MPKLLMISACLVNMGDDRGGVHQDANTVVDVPKDVASALVLNERALYTDPKDDPGKGRSTATDAQIKQAIDAAKAKADAAAATNAKAQAGG